MLNFENNQLTIGKNTYTPSDLKVSKREIILEKYIHSSIYHYENKTVKITRKIAKDGTIRLDKNKVNVMDLAGVAFHLGFDDAMNTLKRCYTFRADNELGYMLSDHDVICAVKINLGGSLEEAEKFFNDFYSDVKSEMRTKRKA